MGNSQRRKNPHKEAWQLISLRTLTFVIKTFIDHYKYGVKKLKKLLNLVYS